MKKKILSLDGGGIKGVFSARFLAEIEHKLGKSICDYFDMIVGTSTGGIIAAALAMGVPAQEIYKLYIDHAEEIFPKNRRFIRLINQIGGSKYKNSSLKKVLLQVFDNKTIESCKTRLLIPSYNLITGNVKIFKTAHSSDLYFDKSEKIVDVLLSTTAAPTFLPPYKSQTGVYIDGGIGANNPTFIGLVEGVSRCGWNLNDIYILSLGCMESINNVTTGKERMGFCDIAKLISAFMNAESQYSNNIANILLGGERYLRINPLDPCERVSLDGTKPEVLEYLSQIGLSQAQKYINQIHKIFFEKIVDRYDLVH